MSGDAIVVINHRGLSLVATAYRMSSLEENLKDVILHITLLCSLLHRLLKH